MMMKTEKKQYQKHAEMWQEYASEHRQLAEWLRELKAYRKAHEEIQHEPLAWEYGQAIEKCLWIIDRCIEEVKADEDSD